MKKTLCILLALLCLMLAACRSAQTDQPDQPDQTAGTEPSTQETTISDLPGQTSAGNVEILTAGSVKIPYTINRSSVRYVTDPAQLPGYEELKGYDDAYFQDHALVLVVETVTSGSAIVEIESIQVSDGVASVTLLHELPEGAGTADMTTWLLWAEVETGLNGTWVLVNPAVESQEQAY